MRFKSLAGGVAACIILGATSALALPINSPVPTNATITFNSLQWAWGGPCPYTGGCANGDLTYQGTQGWRLPTASEMLLVDAFDLSNHAAFAVLFAYAGANVPFGGTDPISGASDAQSGSDGLPATNFACASPYFNGTYSHCDGINGAQGDWSNSALAASLGGQSYSEQLYVRALAKVPEPLTLSIFGAGVAGAAAMRRRKAKA